MKVNPLNPPIHEGFWQRDEENLGTGTFTRASVHVRTLFTSRVNSVRETGTNDSWNAPPGGFKGKYRKCLFYLHYLNFSRELRLQFQPFPPFSSLYPRNYSWFLSYIFQTSIFFPRLSFTVTSTAWGELLATSVQTVSTWHSVIPDSLIYFQDRELWLINKLE